MDFVFDPSLVLYLPLYELDGSSFASKDAYGHTCTVTSALWRPGGYYFDGSADITIPDFTDVGDSNKQISAFVWINCASETKAAFTHLDNTLQSRAWWIGASADYFRAEISDQAVWAVGHRKRYVSSIVTSDETWHLIGFTFNAGTLTIYVDGVADTNPTKSYDDAITTIHNSTADLALGACMSNGVAAQQMTGYLGDAWIYNRALTPLEIQHNYLATKWRYR